jgi:phage replication-related protein YjqB (UPF0714/DUF867 family)
MYLKNTKNRTLKTIVSSVLVFGLLFSTSLLSSANRAYYENPDQIGNYSSFFELSENEVEGLDYTMSYKDNSKNITVFTLHGGLISKGTSEIVNALCAKDKYNSYLFEGIKKENNLSLHITSNKFDEPTAVNLVSNSNNAVSIIGTKEDYNIVYIGGQNRLMARLVGLHLKEAGFAVTDTDDSIPERILGVLDSNIVNKNKPIFDKYRLGGVQIGVSKATRDMLLSDKKKFSSFVEAIDDALSSSWPKAEVIMENLENK